MKKASIQKNPITVSQYINAPERRDTYIYYRIDGCIRGTDVSTHFVYYQNNKLSYAHTASFSRILDSYIKRVVRSRISIVEYNGVSLFLQHSLHPRIISSNAPKFCQQSLPCKFLRRNISAEYQAGRPYFNRAAQPGIFYFGRAYSRRNHATYLSADRCPSVWEEHGGGEGEPVL